MRKRPTRLQAFFVTLTAVVVVGGFQLRSIADQSLGHRGQQYKLSSASGRSEAAPPTAFAPGNVTWAHHSMEPPLPSPDDQLVKVNSSTPEVSETGSEHSEDGSDHSAPPLARVALLFLSRGPMPHEAAWQQFFQAAGKVTPGRPLLSRQSRHVPAGQQLFSAYIHTAPGFMAPAGSFFSTLQVEDPVKAAWGQHSIAEAERRLFIAALHDRANARFVLLSESCMFLYPPATVYLECLAESRSRINACAWPVMGDANRRNVGRLHPDMQTDKLTPATWRKSSQWKVLNRKHAALVAGDNVINPLFVHGCWIEPGWPKSRFCVSDEHYVPSMLAAYGMDNETDCTGGATFALWQHVPGKAPPAHPKTWKAASEVNRQLIDALRVPSYAARPRGRGCNFTAAIASSLAVVASGAPPVTASHGVFADLWRAMPLPLQQLLGGPSRTGPLIMRRRQLLSAGTNDTATEKFDTADAGSEDDTDSWRFGSPTEWLVELEGADATRRQLKAGKVKVPVVNASWVGVSKLLHDPWADQRLPMKSAAMVQRYEAMGHACPLFARKFAASTSKQLALVAQQYILA